jgi:hypothetical protein
MINHGVRRAAAASLAAVALLGLTAACAVGVKPKRAAEPGILDITTGTFTPLPTQIHGCHFTLSSDATAIGYSDGMGRILVINPDGSGQRTVPGLGATPGQPPYSLDLESVSPHGERIALWWNDGSRPAGDASRGLRSNAVVDTRTGRKVQLPGSIAPVQVIFRADGSMVARVEAAGRLQFVLISADGAVLARQDEPAQLKRMTLLTA